MESFLSFVKDTAVAVGSEIKSQAALLADPAPAAGVSGITYITRKLIATSFPYDDSEKINGATIALPVSATQAAYGVSARALSHYLHSKHAEHFMLYNLSEKSYDTTLFDQQVIDFRFPGFPCPPLSQVFALCSSIHAWLTADDANVAVVHCQSGFGRTITACAWYLAWSGQFKQVQSAVSHVCRRLGVEAESVLIPTQMRYLDYLSAMLAGRKPSVVPVVLERVIMNAIPAFGERKKAANAAANAADTNSAVTTATDATTDANRAPAGMQACRPYLQIFKDSQLLFTSTGRDSTELRWYTANDGVVLFPVGLELEGDILIRIRHLTSDNRRVSMLRFGLHTGFVRTGENMRLVKAQLDGAHNDARFPRGFWLDLIFRTDAAASPSASIPSSPSSPHSTELAEARKKQEAYWNQVLAARRTVDSATAQADLSNLLPTYTTRAPQTDDSSSQQHTPASSPLAKDAAQQKRLPTATVAHPAAPLPTAAPVTNTNTSTSSSTVRPSLGALFSTAVEKFGATAPKLTSALWSGIGSSGSGNATNTTAAAVVDPETAKLHAADAAALRQAKKRAATEAAVQAAMQCSPPPVHSPTKAGSSPLPPKAGASSPTAAASSSEAQSDSFADIERYVRTLNNRTIPSAEDSDDDAFMHSGAQHQKDEADLTAAMEQHFREEGDEKPASASSVHTTSSAPTKQEKKSSDADLFASLAAELEASASPAKAAPASSASSVAAEKKDAAASEADNLSSNLEAELAALAVEGGDDAALDAVDEAALLASLESEMSQEQ